MMDLYLNYDCDFECTNLFETICITLARVANPDEGVDPGSDFSNLEERDDADRQKPSFNPLS